jgi:membrane protease YdiL (CAAX protease family)
MTTIASAARPQTTTTRSGFVRSHQLTTYFALTFALSWGAMLMAVGRSGFPATPETLERLLPLAIGVMLVGPPVASVLLTTLLNGGPGLRELLSRLAAVRVGARWYAVALLTAPLAVLTTLAVLSRFWPEIVPGILVRHDKSARLVLGVCAALGAGIFEEIGWTGFATPRLRRRHGVLGAGLLLGFVWGAWHLLPNVWASRTYVGAVPMPLALVAGLFSSLLVFRVAMVWVYDRTQSLLLAMLMHASLTACSIILDPVTAGVRLLAYTLGLAAVFWAFVAAVAIANGGRLTRAEPTLRTA